MLAIGVAGWVLLALLCFYLVYKQTPARDSQPAEALEESHQREREADAVEAPKAPAADWLRDSIGRLR